MARRSTRLSSRSSSTPKRVSLSHDALARTPKTAPVKLSTLAEDDVMPGAFPQSASPPDKRTPSAAPKQGVKVPVHFDDSTPKQRTPLKPSYDEMHPAQHHQSTAKPQDEARWLGFTNMAPHTEPPKQTSRIATLQDTPTRAPTAQSGVTSPQHKFTFQREHSLELSPEAKKLMLEKREEAVRIREQMMAAGQGPGDVEAAVARKIATPKWKNGRFSQAHLGQFQKMDSIAGHASAFRANPTWKKSSPAQPQTQHKAPQSVTNPLKRSPSKAQLDEPDRTPAPALSRSPSKPTFATGGSGLPRATSSKNLHHALDTQEASPAKRVKRFQGDDATITRPSSSGSDVRQPATPSPVKQQPSYPDLTSLASPTQASLARAASIRSTKSSKIPAPTLARSPSTPKLAEAHDGSAGPSTPLLARSPSKAAPVFHNQNGNSQPHSPSEKMSPLLVRSPIKGLLFEKQEGAFEKESGPKKAPLLSRSPLKMSVTKSAGMFASAVEDSQQSFKEPLLSRSPMKISVTKSAETISSTHQGHVQSHKTISLFSRSPMKMSVTKLPDVANVQASTTVLPGSHSATHTNSPAPAPTAETPTKSSKKSLVDRFTFLRSSPVKSILRSPHRLYSDDPAKVAAGTHLATPPKKSAAEMNKKLAAISKTMPNRKHVDFTSSTKARYERAQSEATSTPSKETTPVSEKTDKAQPHPRPGFAEYPTLPTENVDLAITPQKRRQTIAPGDFTFRAGPGGIVFGTSPNAPASAVNKKRPSTIRHVSAEPALLATTTKKCKLGLKDDKDTHGDQTVPAPATTSKKRKFEFENAFGAEGEGVGAMSDQENASEEKADADERSAKMVKQSMPTPEKKVKRPTLGVKPKSEVKGARSASGPIKSGTSTAKSSGGSAKEKKPATISQARLAALAAPKRKG